jgi:hypothetical protein
MALQRPTLLLIFGAGASKDSISIAPEDELKLEHRPPITDDLLASQPNLQDFMTGRGAAKSLAASVVPKLRPPAQADPHPDPEFTRSVDRPSFEDVLTAEYERARDNPILRRAFTSLRFYLRDLFKACTIEWPQQVGGVTNYEWLVRSVESWRGDTDGYVLWVTFNYDGLLDQALEDVYRHPLGEGGADDPQLAGYTSHPAWALIKLHGSFDWRRQTRFRLENDEPANEGMSYRRLEEHWDAEGEPPTGMSIYERRDAWETNASSDRALWIPALMAPLAGKSSFECPPMHLQHLNDHLQSVDLIYTFGWRAQESHFMTLLKGMRRNPPDVYAVTGRGIESATPVAEVIARATSLLDADVDAEEDEDTPLRRADPRAGFSALAGDPSDFATVLGEAVETARARRARRAEYLDMFES